MPSTGQGPHRISSSLCVVRRWLYIREHVIKSTCDENVSQLTLGFGGGGGGGSKAQQHFHRTKSTQGFTYVFHQVLRDVQTDVLLFFLSRPCAVKSLIRRPIRTTEIVSSLRSRRCPLVNMEIYMLIGKIRHKKVSPENRPPLVKGSLEERVFCIWILHMSRWSLYSIILIVIHK